MRAKFYILPVLFLVALFFPFLDNIFKVTPMFVNKENRAMSHFPEVSLKTIDHFPMSYEEYYTDHFRMRNMVMNIYSHLKFDFFNQSPRPNRVLIGSDGWLFLADNEIKNYKGEDLFSNASLKKISEELLYRKSYLEKKNCKMYLAIAPVKSSVYPEYLPSNIVKKNSNTWTDQLIEYLAKNTDINVIDLRKPLLESKKMERVFFKTDNHWSEYGAMVAAEEIIEKINKDFPVVESINPNKYSIKLEEKVGGNLASMIGMDESIKETHQILTLKNGFKAKNDTVPKYQSEVFAYTKEYCIAKNTGNKNLPHALIIRDSFGGNIINFLSESFERTTFIFDAWKYKLNEKIVENEKPDIVVYMVVESHLKKLLENNSHEKKDDPKKKK